MGIFALDHVQLAMPAGREKEARAFYGSLLGFAEQAKPANLVARGGCWFSRGSIKLHLGIEQDFRPAKKPIRRFWSMTWQTCEKHLKQRAAMWLRMNRLRDITGFMSMIPSETASK